jgi:hypothetical protein
LVERFFADYFRDQGVGLAGEEGGRLTNDTIYNAFNKEPLKAVGYGIANARGMPAEIQSWLTGLENLYLLAGIWAEKYEGYDKEKHREQKRLPEHYNHRTIVELVGDLMQKGIRHMESVHQNVAEVTRQRKGDYVTEPELPYAKAINEKVEEARKKIIGEFHIFCFGIRNGIEEAEKLLGQIDEGGIFATGAQQAYSRKVQQLMDLINTSMFPQDFVNKFEGAYGHIYNLKKHAK